MIVPANGPSFSVIVLGSVRVMPSTGDSVSTALRIGRTTRGGGKGASRHEMMSVWYEPGGANRVASVAPDGSHPSKEDVSHIVALIVELQEVCYLCYRRIDETRGKPRARGIACKELRDSLGGGDRGGGTGRTCACDRGGDLQPKRQSDGVVRRGERVILRARNPPLPLPAPSY
jgi:hypothetical protein